MLKGKKIFVFCLGFEAQINSSKASADDALMKLPAISGIIAKAVANNDKTQGILDQLGEFSDAVDMLNKLNNSLAKVKVRETGILHLNVRLSLSVIKGKNLF